MKQEEMCIWRLDCDGSALLGSFSFRTLGSHAGDGGEQTGFHCRKLILAVISMEYRMAQSILEARRVVRKLLQQSVRNPEKIQTVEVTLECRQRLFMQSFPILEFCHPSVVFYKGQGENLSMRLLKRTFFDCESNTYSLQKIWKIQKSINNRNHP